MASGDMNAHVLAKETPSMGKNGEWLVSPVMPRMAIHTAAAAAVLLINSVAKMVTVTTVAMMTANDQSLGRASFNWAFGKSL